MVRLFLTGAFEEAINLCTGCNSEQRSLTRYSSQVNDGFISALSRKSTAFAGMAF